MVTFRRGVMALDTACPPLSSPATTQPPGSGEGVVAGEGSCPFKTQLLPQCSG